MKTRSGFCLVYTIINLEANTRDCFYPGGARGQRYPPDRVDNGSGFSHQLSLGHHSYMLYLQVVELEQAERMEGRGEGTPDGGEDRNVEENHGVTPMIKTIDFVTINNYPVSCYGDTTSISSSSR